jgi:hypothetical protein
MRHWPRVVLLVLFMVASGCRSKATTGDGDGDGGSGAGGAGGRSGGAGAAGSGGDGGVPAECASVACLHTAQDLMTACVGSGACTSQNDLVSMPMTVRGCYDNGIKTLMTIATTTDATNSTSVTTAKVKKGADLCFTRNITVVTPIHADAGAFTSMDVTTLDPSGNLIATAHVDAPFITTVTCPGGAPTVLPDSCGISKLVVSGSYFVDSSAPLCTSGTCTF